MGEQNQEQNIVAPPASEEPKSGGLEELVLKINRATNELIFTDPKTGKQTTIRAKITEEQERAFELKPELTVDEFRDAWERIRKLGITWNTDIPPAPVFLPGRKRDERFWNEFREVQKQFPHFPHELGSTVLHALLEPVGNEDIDKKAGLLTELLNNDYRAEFFFKYAVKVSYFEDIDWEVVVKAYEKGTKRMPKIAYAMLSLILRNPLNTTLGLEEAANEHREPEFITVAVNEKLIDKLISRLLEAKAALEKAQRATDSLTETKRKEEAANESSSS